MKGKRPAKNDLADLLQQLVGEIQVLRRAVDELWGEVQWANRNAASEISPAAKPTACVAAVAAGPGVQRQLF